MILIPAMHRGAVQRGGESSSFTNDEFIGIPLNLHPVLMNSVDPIVRSALFDADTGSFVIPARTAAVFVAAE